MTKRACALSVTNKAMAGDALNARTVHGNHIGAQHPRHEFGALHRQARGLAPVDRHDPNTRACGSRRRRRARGAKPHDQDIGVVAHAAQERLRLTPLPRSEPILIEQQACS